MCVLTLTDIRHVFQTYSGDLVLFRQDDIILQRLVLVALNLANLKAEISLAKCPDYLNISIFKLCKFNFLSLVLFIVVYKYYFCEVPEW